MSQNQTGTKLDVEEDLEGYTFNKTLGQGNFGKVKLATHKITGSQVAIKILEKDLIFEKTDIQRISREIKIMKLVKHPNVIQLYQIIETPKRLYLIMQYAQNGDLFDAIVSKQQLPEQTAQEYFSQLILGLQYLHSVGITHRDLKPQNLLLSGDTIKIADFGLGCFFTDGQMLLTACGSPCYAPPQMLNKVAYDPKKVDLWSSGIILHAMVLGYLPFQDDVTSKLYDKIRTQDFKLPFRLSLPCKNLIKALLNKDPNLRISIPEIKNHQWVKGCYENYKGISDQINPILFKEVCEKYGIVEVDRLINNIKKNKHNNLTTLYFLGQKAILKQKQQRSQSIVQQNISFKNLIDEETKQQNIIQQSKVQNNFLEISKNQVKNDINELKTQTKQEKIETSQDQKEVQKIQLPNSVVKKVEKTELIESINQVHQQNILQKPKQEIPANKQNQKQPSIQNSFVKQPSLIDPDIQEKKIPSQIIQSPKKITALKVQPKKQVKKDINKSKNQESMELRKVQDKKVKEIMKDQREKKLIKNQRMPIHNPHATNKPTPPLYEHSQSKQKPLILKKKIIVKPVLTQPYIYDSKKVVLCSIDVLINELQSKGCNGRVEYVNFGEGCIYLIRHSINGKHIQSIIKQINESVKH